jgi:NAD(P)-dependent dehydrogenase (short-subunit alcohol dehydrogenase family)
VAGFNTAQDRDPLPVHLPAALPLHEGRRLIVTGAARGLGRAVAKLLISQGARVWLLDILADELAATAAELGAPSSWTATDLADPSSIAAAVDAARTGLGGFDGAANIAGIVRHHDPLEIPWGDWEKQFAINVQGSYEVARLVVRAMIDHGAHGAIVNTASEAGKVGHVDSLAYSASKAAVISMTRMLSKALAPHDINVNCVCPGGMPTAMLREVAVAYAGIVDGEPDDVFEQLIGTQLLRHTGEDEVAQVYSFLLSDAANLIRGQAINADGGDTPY